jgi:hypothetical protein
MFIRMISLLLVIFTKVPSSMAVGCYIWLKEICMKELSLIQDAKYDSSALPPRSFVLCPGTVTPFGAGDSFDSWQDEYPLIVFNPNIPTFTFDVSSLVRVRISVRFLEAKYNLQDLVTATFQTAILFQMLPTLLFRESRSRMPQEPA